jgi:endothelin-converting enzyme
VEVVLVLSDPVVLQSPDIMDPPSLQEYYRSVDIKSSTFFENTVSMTQLAVSQQWSALGKPVDRNEW